MGSAWTDSSNWLTGEPCVDRWHGVVCCADSANVATYDPTTRSCDATEMTAADADASTGRRLAMAATTTPDDVQCRSDVISGDLSRARCVVVELDLTDNGLQGTPDWALLLQSMPSLVVLKCTLQPQRLLVRSTSFPRLTFSAFSCSGSRTTISRASCPQTSCSHTPRSRWSSCAATTLSTARRPRHSSGRAARASCSARACLQSRAPPSVSCGGRRWRRPTCASSAPASGRPSACRWVCSRRLCY